MKKILVAFTLLAGALSGTHAGVILSDTFDYANGNLTAVSSGLWSAHSSAGLIPVQVTNGMMRVFLTSSSAEDVNAALSGAPYLASDNSVKLYSSYTLILSNTLPSTVGTYFSHFRGTNTGAATDFGGRVYILRTNTITSAPVPDGKFRLSIGNGAASTNVTWLGQIDQDLSTNTVYTVVTRFVPSTGLATIWINPTAESDPNATAIDGGTDAAPNPFNVFTYAFRQASGGSCYIYVDNLKIGTSFADVAGANTAPTISSIPPQAIPANSSTGPLAFTVGDAETPAANLTVTASSSNPTLVPNSSANLTLSGSGANHSLNVTPAAGQQGSATITVKVSDGVNTSFTTFLLTVGAPYISPVADQVTPKDTPTAAIQFTVGDAETPANLTVTRTSSNPTLVPDASIILSGSGSNRTMTITPAAGQVGVAIITLTVSDGTQTDSSSFNLSVFPQLGLLFGDTFDYADGNIVPNSGATWVVHSGNSNDTLIVNGQLRLSQTNADDIHAFFTNTAYAAVDSGEILYSKFTVNFSELPRGNGGGYFAHYKDLGTGNFRARVFALTNGAAPGKFRLGVANGGNSAAALPQDLSLNTPYTVVTRYITGTTISTLWVNPRYESDSSVSATDYTTPIDIWTYNFRQDGPSSGGIGALLVDNLQIGTSFTDVIPYVAPPTPIPLTLKQINNQVVLSWANPTFSLQSAPALIGPYTTINGATSPYTNTISGSQTFFRLQY